MLSRFQEGAQADITKDAHFFSTLSEMDEHERKKRAHRGSSASVGSFSSFEEKDFAPKEGRRSIAFGRNFGSGEASRGRSFDAPREVPSLDSVVKGFKGRLRALTAGGKTASSRIWEDTRAVGATAAMQPTNYMGHTIGKARSFEFGKMKGNASDMNTDDGLNDVNEYSAG